jgi:hypothetical protein
LTLYETEKDIIGLITIHPKKLLGESEVDEKGCVEVDDVD